VQMSLTDAPSPRFLMHQRLSLAMSRGFCMLAHRDFSR